MQAEGPTQATQAKASNRRPKLPRLEMAEHRPQLRIDRRKAPGLARQRAASEHGA
jgi:hypothetical protein